MYIMMLKILIFLFSSPKMSSTQWQSKKKNSFSCFFSTWQQEICIVIFLIFVAVMHLFCIFYTDFFYRILVKSILIQTKKLYFRYTLKKDKRKSRTIQSVYIVQDDRRIWGQAKIKSTLPTGFGPRPFSKCIF